MFAFKMKEERKRFIMNATSPHTEEPIVLLIDGECLLCNGITHFVVKRDKRMVFRFATLQSPLGQQLLKEGHLPIDDLDTFVMVQSKRYYTKSEAALRVLRKLDGWWRILYMFRLVPIALRNFVYNRIARNRYRLFGKAEVCLLPTAELNDRFLDYDDYYGDKSEASLDEN